VREVSAEKRLPLRRRLPSLAQVMTHLEEAVAKKLCHALMAVFKFTQHLAQQPRDVFVGKGQDPRDDPQRDVVATGIVWAHQHP
jgi:hypothetical protein